MPIRTVGHRATTRSLSFSASVELLLEAARFNDEAHRLVADLPGLVPKGIYRFKSHEEANAFDSRCLAERMSKIAQQRKTI